MAISKKVLLRKRENGLPAKGKKKIPPFKPPVWELRLYVAKT
jgi:hypothetical protein